jgi:hypothetical protein
MREAEGGRARPRWVVALPSSERRKRDASGGGSGVRKVCACVVWGFFLNYACMVWGWVVGQWTKILTAVKRC